MEPLTETSSASVNCEPQSLVQRGQEAMKEALSLLEEVEGMEMEVQEEGWKVGTVEVTRLLITDPPCASTLC